MKQFQTKYLLGAVLGMTGLALAAGAAMAEGTKNLNDLLGTGGGAQAGTGSGAGGSGGSGGGIASALGTERVIFAERATGLESDESWLKVNNAGPNIMLTIQLGDDQIGPQGQIVMYTDDVDWNSGQTAIDSPLGTGQKAGEGFFFSDLPAYSVIVYLKEAQVGYLMGSNDPAKPLVIDLKGQKTFTLVVNDGPEVDGQPSPLVDNWGAYDVLFKPFVKQ